MDEKRFYDVLSEVQKETAVIHWKINNFCNLPISTEDTVISPSFVCAGYSWQIEMLPDWGTPYEQRYVRFELKLVTLLRRLPQSISVRFSIKFGDFFEERQKATHDPKDLGFSAILFRKKNIIKHLSENEVLILECQLEIAKTLQQAVREKKKRKSPGSVLEVDHTDFLLTDLLSSYSNKQLCDVVLKAEGKEFPAHRSLLAARSTVLADMFRCQTQGNQIKEIFIAEVSAGILEKILLFLYTGKLCQISLSDSYLVYAAASMFALEDLKKECAEFISANLSRDNVIDVILLAWQHTDKSLTETTSDFLLENWKHISATEQWKDFKKNRTEPCKEILDLVLFKVRNKKLCSQDLYSFDDL